jgi:UDP-N-acetylmuramoyl-L-alanyl-D-glutamate--2,6-diaminopimelate ligase
MMIDPHVIKGITSDSRQVKQGFMFVALPGVKVDGHNFIPAAIAAGATHVVLKAGSSKADGKDVTWIETDNPRLYLAQAAAAFYKVQPDYVVAVTGTNGKTSTVNFVRMILSALGKNAASLGTIGLIGDGLSGYAGMTTPDPVSLFSTLADVAGKGISHLAMEASSHGLQQYRLDGVHVRAAGFTNLTRDHLDYHGSMEEYLQAKIRLFSDIVMDDGTAVLNADVSEYAVISHLSNARGLRVISYGRALDADIRIVERVAVSNGQNLAIQAFGKIFNVHLNLVGEFQAMNVLCAAGLVLSDTAISVDVVMNCLERIEGVPGRLQAVPYHQNNIGVYVDYAHTPDGLETILRALRPHTQGRLICVFGCGGDRDRGKRPVMGEISNRLADITIVTDDNPRSEDPAFVRSEVMAGAPNAIEVAGRRNAIAYAVQQLEAGDVLVLAGKGHEQGQVFATHTEPFDDLTEAQAALNTYLS